MGTLNEVILYAGLDEAGLGPLLGPLSTASASSSLCPTKLNQSLQTLKLKESKQIYRSKKDFANLEAKVLALWLSTQGRPWSISNSIPATDIFNQREYTALIQLPWYQQLKQMQLPIKASSAHIWQFYQELNAQKIHVKYLQLQGLLYSEKEFNQSVTQYNNKSLVLRTLIGKLLQNLSKQLSSQVTSNTTGQFNSLNCTVDRLGGLKYYSPWLCQLFNVEQIKILTEEAQQSHYLVKNNIEIKFLVKGDEQNLLCSIASLWAKYRREVLMHIFNLYWQEQAANINAELPYTTGYYRDGSQFLHALQKLQGFIPPNLKRLR